MAELLGLIVIGGFFLALGLWLATRGGRLDHIPPARRRRLYLAMVVLYIPPVVAAWALVNGHAVIGITILVLVFIVPNILIAVLRVRGTGRG
jgi:hypothetical protein